MKHARELVAAVATGTFAAFIGLAFTTQATLAQQPTAREASPAAQAPDDPTQVCAACHPAQVATYASSIHGQKGHPRSPANAGGCSTCHGGDVLKHAQAGGGSGVGGIRNPGPRSK